MKKLLLIFCLCAPLALFAQFNFGLRLGGNMHNLVLSPDEYTAGNVKLGLVGGLFFRIESEKRYFQFEGLFSQRNADFTFDNILLNEDTTFSNKVNYIDIPLTYGIRMGEHFRVGTGPVFYILNKDKVSYEVADYAARISIDKNIFKNLNMGWQAAMVVDVPKFLFELRYELGFNNVINEFDIPQTDITISPKARSNMWQFTIGYKFL